MYTSFLTLSLMLAPVLPTANVPAWQSSYSTALVLGQKAGKPVAVFVGSGAQGQAAVVKEGQFSADTLTVLAQKYICVYLDRSQSANQRLVRDLGISQSGLVVSDRTGNYQAFHHDGSLAQDVLGKQLQRFADPKLVVTTTLSNTAARVSYYPSDSSTTVPRTRTVSC